MYRVVHYNKKTYLIILHYFSLPDLSSLLLVFMLHNGLQQYKGWIYENFNWSFGVPTGFCATVLRVIFARLIATPNL